MAGRVPHCGAGNGQDPLLGGAGDRQVSLLGGAGGGQGPLLGGVGGGQGLTCGRVGDLAVTMHVAPHRTGGCSGPAERVLTVFHRTDEHRPGVLEAKDRELLIGTRLMFVIMYRTAGFLAAHREHMRFLSQYLRVTAVRKSKGSGFVPEIPLEASYTRRVRETYPDLETRGGGPGRLS